MRRAASSRMTGSSSAGTEVQLPVQWSTLTKPIPLLAKVAPWSICFSMLAFGALAMAVFLGRSGHEGLFDTGIPAHWPLIASAAALAFGLLSALLARGFPEGVRDWSETGAR